MKSRAIGFTGTRRGMTPAQAQATGALLAALCEGVHASFHHGDCVGADAQAHELARRVGMSVYLHPPTNKNGRAYCQGAMHEFSPLPYLDRNRSIATCAEIVLAAPDGFEEKLRSGTWSTVRAARRSPACSVVVVLPDGRARVDCVALGHGEWLAGALHKALAQAIGND